MEDLDPFDEVLHKEPVHQLKDLNLLDPFFLTERRFNRSLERQLVFPRNPTDNVLKKQPSGGNKSEGCRHRPDLPCPLLPGKEHPVLRERETLLRLHAEQAAVPRLGRLLETLLCARNVQRPRETQRST